MLLSSAPAGKLLTLGESSRSCKGESIKATKTESFELDVSSVTRPQGYEVEGTVNGLLTLFLVDTGRQRCYFEGTPGTGYLQVALKN